MNQHDVETVDLSTLKPHPRNYRSHPEDQLEHIIESIREHGCYRNIIIAREGTILAGHGVAEAAKKMGFKTVPAIRLDLGPDDPKALKVLTGDNEIARFGEVDDRLLTELLKEVKDSDEKGLLGTGYDEKMLAALAMVTRPESELEDFDAAAEWVGMPEYESKQTPHKVVVQFRNEEDRDRFAEEFGFQFIKKEARTWSMWWPERDRQDLRSLQFEG